jgi:hypothetical protein
MRESNEEKRSCAKERTVVIRVVHQEEISTNKAKFEYRRETKGIRLMGRN